jgi:acetyl-CoA decarbonylase/synthase complex subunit delta
MPFERPKEKWRAAVNEVRLGATPAEGGTRSTSLKVGGEATLPFLSYEAPAPNRPVIAMEVHDRAPTDWPEPMADALGDVLGDPAAWAHRCVDEHGADMICLRLVDAHPDMGDASPGQCAETVKKVLEAVGVPLIIWGCGDRDKDNAILPEVSQAAAKERCCLGSAQQESYKTIAACALADGHVVIDEAPLDINIQKQVNILVNEMGVKLEDILMYQSTGGLGYGVEYAYTIMERTRLAALGGDKMLSMPMLAIVGAEAWRAKEARLPEAEAPEWGSHTERAILWEAVTAQLFVQGGTDLLVMWHPEAVRLVKESILAFSAAVAEA